MTADELETFETLVKPCDSYEVAYGCVLCVVELYDCVPTATFHGQTPVQVSEQEAALGNYTLGRFAWLTRNCRKLECPVPVIGRQGFWNLPADVEALVIENLPWNSVTLRDCYGLSVAT
jgi:hypothetical protein